MIVQISQLFLTILAVMLVLSVALASAWFTIKALFKWSRKNNLRRAVTCTGSAIVVAVGMSVSMTVAKAIDALQGAGLPVPLEDIGLMCTGFYLVIGAFLTTLSLLFSRYAACD